MGDMVACLRGWHPGLAYAELSALLPQSTLTPEIAERWCRVDGAAHGQRIEALNVASGLQCFLLDGVVQSTNETSPEAWLENMHLSLIHI